MSKFATILGALLLFSAPSLQARDADPSQISAIEAAQLESALNRGDMLYRYDQAAWHTTDAMLEEIPDPGNFGVRGWVVTPVDGGLQVTYWKASESGFEGVFSAVYDGANVIERRILSGDDAKLSKGQLELVRASGVADPSKLERCSQSPFNTVVMPSGKDSGSHYVYFLTPQTTLKELPLGGHYRFEVLADRVVSERKFTNGCIGLQLGDDGSNKKPVALAISHSLDTIPTEIHAFSVFAAGMPIYVIIAEPERTWSVEISSGVPRARLVN